jgi:glycosyltransferase involved in cell wall biosynthesis
VRYLFVHQHFPGQFLHLVRHLLKQPGNEIVFVSEPNANQISGVRKVAYRMPPVAATAHSDAQEFEAAVIRAEAVARTAAQVKALGFTPDIIIGHHGWGELLNMQDVWPDVPLLGYLEFYYHVHGVDVNFDPEFPVPASAFARIRAKNAVNLLAMTNPGEGQTPTAWQRSTYPAWARDRINLLPEGVNLETCRPDPALRREMVAIGDIAVAPGEKLVTYVARDLEPYRGFHVVMRALPRLLAAHPDLRAILVGGDGVSYGARLSGGSWKDYMLREAAGRIDPDRVHFPGKIPYDQYLRMLRRSDAHVYLTYPFVASWSLREALATGCAVVASDTPPLHEFVTDGRNGLLTPCLDPHRLAERVLEVLEDQDLNDRLRANARAYAERHLRMSDHLAGYEALIGRMVRG